MSQAEVLIDSPRKEKILASLKTLVNELTGINPENMDIHANFLEAGIDSLTLIQATQLVKEQFDVKLSVVQLLEQLSNIDSLATYIDRSLPPDPGGETPKIAPEPPPDPGPETPKIAAEPPPDPGPETPKINPDPTALPLSGTALDQIMSQQLQVMAKQLEMMRAAYQRPVVETRITEKPSVPSRAASVTQNQPTFVPYQPIEPGPTDGLTDRQRKHLDDLIARHTARTRESKRLTQEFRRHLADSRTSFGFRLLWKEIVYPIISDRSSGSKVWDVDGNEYVDISMGFGVHLFGHSPDFIDAALKQQIDQKRLQLGPQVLLAGKVARLISELANQERVNFCNSGTEAVMGALRIARTVTRRSRVALFGGAYHGWSDGTLAKILNVKNEQRTVPVGPGISANAVEDIVVLAWDRPESIEYLNKHAHELAAVLVEPVQSRRPDIQPREFLHQLRDITTRTGTALILDEMITGFRIHSGGAQAWFGVQADISTYGKVIGGGLPVGVIAGKASFMDAFDGGMWNYGDASYPEAEKTLFAGAFFKHPLTMSAAEVILERLRDNPSLLPELNDRTARLVAMLNRYFEDTRLPINVVNFGSLFRFMFAPELKYVDLFFYHMLDHGVFIWEGRNCFLSTAHTDDDLDRIARAVQGSVEQMRAGGFWPEPPGRTSNGDGPSSTATITVNEQKAPVAVNAAPKTVQSHKAPQFSLYYFGNYDSEFSDDKYELLFKGARYADEHDFHAVWIPERHFHAFGGFSPNPSVVAAALARETQRLRIHAGSVVLPLHNPIRVAEEWSVVDNLSHGRVGISFASGWQPNDFVFAPDAYATRHEHMFRGIELVQKLWSGEPIKTRSGDGKEISVRLTPMPMQRKLPIWLTGANMPTFVKAGELGTGLLTNLQSLSIEELAERLAVYRETLERNGHDPASGHVTLLLHTFVVPDLDHAREKARQPLYRYMKSSLGLMGNLVKGSKLKPLDFEKLSEEDLEYILSTGYNRYAQTASLIGTPESCAEVIERLVEIGVNEIGCMVDFGIDTGSVVDSLSTLNTLRLKFQDKPSSDPLPITVQTQEIKSIPLTDAQRQLWITTQIGSDASRAYNESVTLTMRGPFKAEAMRQALLQLIERHEELRATFTADGPAQLIHPSLDVDIPLLDFSHVDASVRESEAQEWITREVNEPFDLENGPLVRFRMIKMSADRHLLVLGNHHLVADGQSWGVLLTDLEALYAAARRGTQPQLAPPRSFGEFADRQRQIQEKVDARTSEEYWVDLFAESIPVLYMPTDRPRPPVQTYNGSRVMISTGPTLFGQVKKVCNEQGSTVYMMLLAAYSVLLHRLSRQEKLIVGVPAAGQVAVGHKDTVGYCINLLPLLSDASGNPTFSDFLAGVKRRLMEGLEHQHYSFGTLLKRLDIPWDASHAPLFTTTFNVDRSEKGKKFFDLEFDAAPNPTNWSSDELRMAIIEADDELVLDCIYNTDLFDESTIRGWMDHFQTLLGAIARDSRQPLWQLPLLSESERAALLYRDRKVQPETGIHELFEAQAKANPQAVAIEFGSERITYGELNSRADALARRLQAAGVAREVFVGLCTERSIEAVVGMLGVLKAGGAYVHLDPAYPPERLRFMIEDTGLRLVLAQRKWLEQTSSLGCEVFALEDASHPGDDASFTLRRVLPDQAAYVYYTSGSTGQPKGVTSTHSAVVNFLNYVVHEHQLTANDVVLQVAALSFDASVRDIIGPLAAGAKVVLPDETDAKDPAALIAAIERHRVTCLLSLVPARFSGLLNSAGSKRDLSSVRLLLLSGEHLPIADCCRAWELFGPQVTIVNQYGPTECTMISTFERVTTGTAADGNALAGTPIDNMHVLVLDDHLELSPPGVPGEVFLAGDGLARGYLNRADLTAEKFMAHPHSTRAGARIYRTGDLGRLLPNRSLQILGRLDHQLKIRGLRIEPAEIEVVLGAHPGVRDAVIVAREDVPNDKRLVAYVVCRATDTPPSASELRAYVREHLPEYMEPSAFVFLSELPLTRNGKVDRQALPAPEARVETGADFAAPRNDLEQLLTKLWGEVLMIEGFGIDDDFFELGGNSLLGTQLLARIRDTLNVELPLRSLFEKPTIAGLAADVEEIRRAEQISAGPQIERVPRDQELPLSFAQQRLWFMYQLDPNNRAYNVRGGIRLQGELNVRALEQSLNEIIRRHEVLRTSFAAVDGKPHQVIEPSLTLHLPVIDLRALPANEREAKAKEIAIEEAERLFDLSRCPLLRLSLFRLGDQDHALAYSLHHIICDGWSMGILINEISLLYMAFSTGAPSPLPELEVQYADFANWQQQWLQGEVLETQLAYWTTQLRGAPAELELPTDFPRPSVRSYRGARHSLALPSALSQTLRDLSQQEGVTLFMTLLAAYQVLLSRYTGQRDIVVGSDIANRNVSATQTLIGFFVNQIVLRVDLSDNPDFIELLGRVRDTALEAYANQDLPFEKLVEAMEPERHLNRSPLFQVKFLLQNTPQDAELSLRGLTLRPFNFDIEASTFDLLLSMLDTEQGLRGTFEYSTDLFAAATIERFGEHFERLLESIAANPRQRVSEIEFLSEAEREQVLVGWNDTGVEYPREKSIHQLFQEQVERTPDAVALVFEDRKLTYRELNTRANQLAHYLRQSGVERETLVGLCVDRSLEAVVGLLGTLKAGAAFVPLDASYPLERLSFMLEDARVPVLLTQEALLERLPAQWVQTISLDTEWDELIASQSESNIGGGAFAENLAYVIYTSGSTGRPKGVMVQHGGLVNMVQAQIKAFAVTAESRVLQFASLSFDASVSEVFMALLSGASLYLASRESLMPGPPLLKLLRENEITTVTLPPSVLAVMDSDELPALQTIVAAGESCPLETVARWGKGRRFIDAYGPTEDTVCATLTQLDGTRVTIGKPIANNQIYILDAELQPAPVGVFGELHIGGVGLARGYLNRPALTAEKFIPNSFSKVAGERLYKSGDLARWLPDGHIDFAGRIDDQLKIRGYRIEAGEIESVLNEHPDVRTSIVLEREDDAGEKRLAAYCVRKNLDDGPLLNLDGSENGRVELWPSVAEFYIYDDLLYHAMTADQRRNESYKVAINRHVKDKVVLDLGTGKDAILARFCVEAGAARVYAIELLDEPYQKAKETIERLGLTGKIILIQGNSMEVELPEKIDVCVSEIVGPIGGCEGAAAIINDAWKFMKPGGVMIPSRSVTKIAAITLTDDFLTNPTFSKLSAQYAEKVFEQVGHRFDLRLCMKNFSQANIISNDQPFEALDFMQQIDAEFDREIELTIDRDEKLVGFVVWLNLHTVEDEVINILEDEYCWLPVYLPIFYPGVDVHTGDRIRATVSGRFSDNQLNLDYTVKGSLLKQSGAKRDFEYTTYHHREIFQATEFYRRIFPDGRLNILEGFQPQVLTKKLKTYLKDVLPEFMIPADVVILDSLPVTPNGKIDRKALPDPGQTNAAALHEYVGPRNALESQLAAMWEDLLGVHPVGVRESFFELGGHSLLAVRLMARIKKQFGLDLPISTLFRGETIEEFAKILAEQGPAWRSSPLVPIQPGGTRAPFFCVHAMGGNVNNYYLLARHLGSDQPFYGLQAPPLHEATEEDARVELMATRYVEALREVQPVGPYLLGGYSFGSFVAYEMARQLQEQGQRVDLLALFDTYSPSVLQKLSPDRDIAEMLVSLAWTTAREQGKHLLLSVDELRKLSVDEQFDFFLEKMRDEALAPPEVDRELLAQFLKGSAARERAAQKYAPQKYQGHVTVLKCEQRDQLWLERLAEAGLDATDPTLGWGTLAQSVNVVDIAGHHDVICQEPYVQSLAHNLRTALDAATVETKAASA